VGLKELTQLKSRSQEIGLFELKLYSIALAVKNLHIAIALSGHKPLCQLQHRVPSAGLMANIDHNRPLVAKIKGSFEVVKDASLKSLQSLICF